MTKWLVLEWIGYWAIPDKYHGGINPGPYESKEAAASAIKTYLEKELSEYCRDDRYEVLEVNWPLRSLDEGRNPND